MQIRFKNLLGFERLEGAAWVNWVSSIRAGAMNAWMPRTMRWWRSRRWFLGNVFGPNRGRRLSMASFALARRRGEARADTYIGGIATGCLSLSIFPERGTMRDDIRPELRTKAYAKRVTIAFPVNGLDRDRCDSRRVLWRAGFRAVAPSHG